MRCLSCKYDLRKLTRSGGGGEHRCPECGLNFDSDDPTTFLTRKRIRNKRLGKLFFYIYGIAFLGSYLVFLKSFIEDNVPIWFQVYSIAGFALGIAFFVWMFIVIFIYVRQIFR